MPLINSSQELKEVCDEIKKYPYIAVDSEFLRDKSYFPKLCLLQIATKKECYLIDVLAKNIDLSPVREIFEDEAIKKIMHSCSQDLEIFYNDDQLKVNNLFDTQIALSAIGFHSQLSYAALIKEFLGVKLDKSSQFSAWDNRPLSDIQVKYAINDVKYLIKVYPLIVKKLKQFKRLKWVEEEFERITSPDNYKLDLDHIWQKFTLPHADAFSVSILKHTVQWRERTAMKLNIPKYHLLKDNVIIDLCKNIPEDFSYLTRNRNLRHLKIDQLKSLFHVITEAVSKPATEEEIIAVSITNIITVENKAIIDILKTYLSITATKNKISPGLIANNDMLLELVCKKRPVKEIFKPKWRYDIFGKYAEQILQGKFAIFIKNGKIELIKI